MAFVVKTITMVAIATLAIKVGGCEAYSACNITVKEEPRGRVELIELMLPRHARGSDSKRMVSGDEPRYEIFIKQNKNARDPMGTHKIKIFVESDDYGSEKQAPKHHNRTSPNLHADNKNNRAVPLAIQSGGLNADKTTDKDHTDNRGSYASDSDKGQVYSVNSYVSNASVVDELERKNTYRTDKPIRQHDAQTVKDARSQPRPNGSPPTSRQKDTREQKNDGEANLFLLSKSTEAFKPSDSQKRTIQENTARIKEPEVYKASNQRPLISANSPWISDTESHHIHHDHHHHEPPLESLPSPYHKDDTIPSVGKQLVYEPDRGISATQTNSYNTKRFAEHPRTSTGNVAIYKGRELAQAEDDGPHGSSTGTSSYRRPPTDDLGRRPVREEPAADRSSYRSDGYSNARSHSTNGFPRDGSSYREESSGGERRRVDASFSSDIKGSYGSEAYDHSRDLSVVSNTELPYQIVPNNERVTRYETTTKRPAGHKDYYGFPESYTSTMYEASRPTSYEGPTALPGSSCPSVFKYVEYGDNRWYADVYVSTDETLFGMRLDIILSKRADLLTAVAAEVKSTDNIRFMILSLKKKLTPGSPEVVRIMVKYNVNERAPFVKTISLNGRQICPPVTTKTTKRPNLVYPIDVIEQKRTTERIPEVYTRPPALNEYTRTTAKPTNFKRTTPAMSFLPEPNPDAYEGPDYSTPNRPTTARPSSIHQTFTNRPASPVLSNSDNRRPGESLNGGNDNYNNNNYGGSSVLNKPSHDRKPTAEGKKIECGLPAIQPAPLITNGQNTARGQWPWHAALYKNIVPNLTYSCGGSLVTNLHVITAAHCVTSEYSSVPLDPKILLVYLGKYHLYVSTENGIAAKGVSRVTVHPNYNVTDFRSDIAVLTLSSRVEFTDLIRPVCLWDKRNTRIEDIVGLQGTVVGWGYDDSKQLTKELKQANMPVVKHNECLWSYPDFYPKFTSNTTYCAGFKNGTSVCNGDSGGGMVFPIKVNREERWFLRGLVSLSPGLKDMRVCDTHHYVVFTDVAKYLPWLEDIIS